MLDSAGFELETKDTRGKPSSVVADDDEQRMFEPQPKLDASSLGVARRGKTWGGFRSGSKIVFRVMRPLGQVDRNSLLVLSRLSSN